MLMATMASMEQTTMAVAILWLTMVVMIMTMVAGDGDDSDCGEYNDGADRGGEDDDNGAEGDMTTS